MRVRQFMLGLFSLIITSVVGHAQDFMLSSQYFEMWSLYNPADASRSDKLKLRFAGRWEQCGSERFGRGFAGSLEMPLRLKENIRVGIGLTGANQFSSMTELTTAGANASLRVMVKNGYFSSGIRLGFLKAENNKDKDKDTRIKGTVPDLGVGIAFGTKDCEGGISVIHLNHPRLIRRKKELDLSPDEITGEEEERKISIPPIGFVSATGNIPVENTLIYIIPSIILGSDFSEFTGAANVMARYNGVLSLGAGYRWNEAAILYLGMEWNGFHLGYSYDYPLSNNSREGKGSHEIVAGYSVRINLSEKKQYKQKSIRLL